MPYSGIWGRLAVLGFDFISLLDCFHTRRFGEQFIPRRRVELYRLDIDAAGLNVVAIVIDNVRKLHGVVINVLEISNLMLDQTGVPGLLVSQTHRQMSLAVEQQIGGLARFQPDGDGIGALARTCLFATGVPDLDFGTLHRRAQQAINVEIQPFNMLLNLFVGLVFQGFGVAVVNPSGLTDVDLNAAVSLLTLAEFGPLLVGIDYPINELYGDLRQAFVELREHAGRHDARVA